MSDPIEAAKTEMVAWAYEAEGLRDSLKATKNIVQAFMRAAIGCPRSDHDIEPCPAEHVEIVFLGETIWADPDKCEWRCSHHFMFLDSCMARHRRGDSHQSCGWQPKWSAIKGDE